MDEPRVKKELTDEEYIRQDMKDAESQNIVRSALDDFTYGGSEFLRRKMDPNYSYTPDVRGTALGMAAGALVPGKIISGALARAGLGTAAKVASNPYFKGAVRGGTASGLRGGNVLQGAAMGAGIAGPLEVLLSRVKIMRDADPALVKRLKDNVLEPQEVRAIVSPHTMVPKSGSKHVPKFSPDPNTPFVKQKEDLVRGRTPPPERVLEAPIGADPRYMKLYNELYEQDLQLMKSAPVEKVRDISNPQISAMIDRLNDQAREGNLAVRATRHSSGNAKNVENATRMVALPEELATPRALRKDWMNPANESEILARGSTWSDQIDNMLESLRSEVRKSHEKGRVPSPGVPFMIDTLENVNELGTGGTLNKLIDKNITNPADLKIMKASLARPSNEVVGYLEDVMKDRTSDMLEYTKLQRLLKQYADRNPGERILSMRDTLADTGLSYQAARQLIQSPRIESAVARMLGERGARTVAKEVGGAK